MRYLKADKGLTLIEIMIGITILVLAVIPLMKMLGDSIRGAQTMGEMSKATQLAQDLMEEIKSKKWDETTPSDGGPAPGGSVIGLDGGEPPRDDIDDYNNYGDTSDNKFTRQVNVIYVTIPSTAPGGSATVTQTLPVGTTDHFKQITVTVKWPGHMGGANSAPPVVIKTVQANYRRY